MKGLCAAHPVSGGPERFLLRREASLRSSVRPFLARDAESGPWHSLQTLVTNFFVALQTRAVGALGNLVQGCAHVAQEPRLTFEVAGVHFSLCGELHLVQRVRRPFNCDAIAPPRRPRQLRVLRGQDRQKFVAFGSSHFRCHSSAHSMRERFFRIITISRSFGLTPGVEAVHATFVVMKDVPIGWNWQGPEHFRKDRRILLLQRSSYSFPMGLPGIALLLLRITVGLTMVIRDGACLPEAADRPVVSIASVLGILAGGLLSVGFRWKR
jgi:hypothetical protein